MKKMWILAMFIIVAMISCDKSEVVQPEDPNNPNNPDNTTVAISITSTPVVPIPAGYSLVDYYIQVMVVIDDTTGTSQSIRIAPGNYSRAFTGDTARLWLGKTLIIFPVLELRQGNSSYVTNNFHPFDPRRIEAKVGKKNAYTFNFTQYTFQTGGAAF